MIVTIHQPSYLPWIPFLEKGLRSDVYVLLDNVQFEKNSEQNRNRIKSPQGEMWLTVPVSRSLATRICDVKIAGHAWKRKHRRAIEQNYGQAPHYAEIAPPLFERIEGAGESLAELNIAVDELFLRCAGFAGSIVRASAMDVEGSGSQRVLALCQALGASRYLSGGAGRSYLDLRQFAAAGIEVLFQDYRHEPYPQLYPQLGFVPRLSALDLLMNVGTGEPAGRFILENGEWREGGG